MSEPERQLDPLYAEGLDWLARLASDDATDADRLAFEEWRVRSPAHEQAIARAEALSNKVRVAGRFVLARSVGPERVIAFGPRRLERRALLGGAIAAGAAALVIGVSRLTDMVPPRVSVPDFSTKTGERRTLRIAGGLEVMLDAQTQIAIASQGTQHVIELLVGRAHLVAGLASGQVTVRAGAGETAAARARFDARLNRGEACITCLHGDVRIAHPQGTVRLQSREQIAYTDDRLKPVRRIDLAVASAWRGGKLIFRRTPLSEVIREINRYREGEVVLANRDIGGRPINGVFDVGHLESAIVQVQQVSGASAIYLPGGIVILR